MLAVVSVLSAGTAAGCRGGDGSGTVDAAVDAAIDASFDASIDAASLCCEIEEPTCDCFQIGGTRDLTEEVPAFQCTAICDAEPDGWVDDVDENGCPILRWVGGTGSCLPFADASVTDAATADGGPIDAS